MQLTYLFKGLELSPKVVERVVGIVAPSSYDERREPERFSFCEAVAHLADWETINLERIRRGVEKSGSIVQGLDESQRAVDGAYATLDPKVQAGLFGDRRAETLRLLRSLSEADWRKTVVHSERGEMTILELTVSILGHDMYHLEQFTQYLP